MTETSIKNNKALEKLNDKLLKIVNDRGILASHSLSRLSKMLNPKHTSQFKLLKDPDSNGFNDLIKKIPVTIYDNLLRFRYTDKESKLERDLLKKITNKNYNVDLANLLDEELLYDLAKEMCFDERASGKKSVRDESLKTLIKSPAIMVFGI